MKAYKSFCAHLSERKKPGRKFFKKNKTHMLAIYLFHSYSRRDNKKKKTSWNCYACPVARQVAGYRNEDPNLQTVCDNVPPVLHGNRWVWSNGKMVISRGKSKIRAEKLAEV